MGHHIVLVRKCATFVRVLVALAVVVLSDMVRQFAREELGSHSVRVGVERTLELCLPRLRWGRGTSQSKEDVVLYNERLVRLDLMRA